MANDNKKYIPALRFPEFQNDGEWLYEYGNVLFDSIVNKNHNSELPILAITQENGAIPRDMINYRVSVEDKSIEGYKVVDVGDFIISLRTFQGGIEYSRYKGICSPAYIVLRKKHDNICDDFYRYYFKTYQYIQDLNRNLEGIRDGKMVSYKQFSEIKIPYPTLSEQKKIADCFVSIDEEIDATKRKFEQLKEHKKGLMQKLFPAKGKALPELRFPEFQNDGEWIPRPLSDILNYEQPTPYIVEDDTYKKEGTPVLTANKGFILGYTDESLGIYNKLPVIIFDDFTTDKKYVDFPFKIKSSAIKLLTLKDEERDNLRFIFECMNNIVFEEKEHKRYYISEYQHINIYVPSSLQEQNQIADTLLSVDKQISEYDKKIKALEHHKKGLMQQLFPKL